MTTFTEITERKRIEAALQDSEQRYRLLFELNPVPMWVYDLDTLAFLAVNDAAVLHYGYAREEFLQKTIVDIRPPEDAPHLREHLAQAPVDRLYTTGSWRHMKRDGTIIDVEITAHNIDFTGHRAKLVLAVDVTERLRAEQELRASEERFRVLVEHAPEAITVYDVELNRFVDANVNAERMFACTREALERSTPAQFYLPAQPDGLPVAASMQAHTDAALAGHEVVLERAIRNAEGRELICEVRLVRLPSLERKLIRASYIDITERKRTEEALRLTQFSVDRAGDMIFWLDFSGNLLYVNEAGCRRLGYGCDELCHMTVFDIDPVFPREDWAGHSERLRQQGAMLIETQHRTKTGELFPVEISINYLEFNGKEYNFAFARDITERKRTEAAIKRESAFLASAIELLPFPIFIVTPDYIMIRQNRASLDLQQAPGALPLGGVEFLDPQTHSPYPVQDWLQRLARQGEAIPTRELLLRQPDGRELSILLQSAPIFIHAELVAAVVAIQDITALKEADRAKNQFLMVLSHELKTPLTNIIGWVQFAQDAPEMAPEALTTILRNANEQKALLERLLVLSRILTGKLVLALHPADLWQLAMQAAAILQPAADARHVQLVLLPPTGELRMPADSKLLQQALCEVIENAVNFTAAGGQVTIEGRREEAANVLIARDTGQGIAPEQLLALLKPFSQYQRKEEIGGIGIGLALVRGIIETHGGQVTITSPGVGQGTTVTLRFPHVDQETGPGSEAQ